MIMKWDKRFLALAEHIAGWSKDPSTKVGCVIVQPYTRKIISTGYNGFPRQMNDEQSRYENREFKYAHIIHAEENAILFANDDLQGATLYNWPFMPCSTCAVKIAQVGITRVVSPWSDNPRWVKSFEAARLAFQECRVILELDMPK